MPAFRCADTITRAIDSALRQEVEVEIIVVNDASPEDLDAVMATYAQDERVRYVKNPVNLGAAASRNKGVELAQGEYVAFLDADDCWREGKLLHQITLMEQEDVVLSSTARELMSSDGEPTGHIIPVKSSLKYKDLLRHNPIACSSVVLRTEVAREFPMEHEDSHEDYIAWMRILKKYQKAVGVNEPYLLYQYSNTGKSGSKGKSAKMTFRAYRYMGFGYVKSMLCFVAYAFHGVWKYSKLQNIVRKH